MAASASSLDVRVILQDVGGFGIYQKFLCVVVVAVINGFCALSLVTQLFSLVTPDHWCWNSDVAALEEQLPLAQEDTKKFSIPIDSTGHLPWWGMQSADASLVSFSQCQRYDGDLVGAYISWVAAKRPPSHIPVTPGNNTQYPVRECDQGWIYNHTFHTLSSENDWVCNSKWKPYALHTVFWLGASVGAFICAYLANKFGRRITLIAVLLAYFVGGTATLTTSEFILLIISRFVIGMGQLAAGYIALLLLLELCDEQHQVIPVLISMVAHTTVTIMASWVVRVVTSWWWLTLIPTILSAVLCFMLAWIVPESPWWMSKNGRHKEALQILQRITEVNRKEPLCLNYKILEESCDLWSHRNKKLCCLRNSSNSKNDLLRCKKLYCYSCRKQFIFLNILWVLCGVCYYGNYYTSINLFTTALDTRSNPHDGFVSYWYAALMEIPVWILPFILQGQPKVYKRVLVLSLTTAAFLSICHAVLCTGYVVISLTLGLVNRFAITVAYYMLVQRYWEINNIFDKITKVNTVCLMSLAVAIVPSIIYLGDYYRQIPSLMFGIVALVTAVIALFFPMESYKDEEVGSNKPLYLMRQWLQFRKYRKTSMPLTDTQTEDTTCIISTLPYNPLEST